MAEPGRKTDPAVVEATAVFDALTRCAEKHLAKIGCYGAETVVPGLSISAKDLAGKAVLRLLARGWVPGAGGEDIRPLGYVTVRNLFIDSVRSSPFKKIVNCDDGEIEDLVETDGQELPQRRDEWRLILEKIRALLDDEMEVKYLDCLLAGAKANRDVADCLGISSLEELEKIKKRIVYKGQRWLETWDTVRQ
jgi:DNA-directed RNA polymerase specialized sigma24 family protein